MQNNQNDAAWPPEKIMHGIQRYSMTIHDLFKISNGEICGAEAEIAILDSGIEIDRVKLSGKCQSKGGYRRSYTGKPGLSAKLVSGPGCMTFEAVHVGAVIPAV